MPATLRTTASLFIVSAALLGGCAGIGTVSSDVSSFGDWPAGRAPGSYAFERLPSQQARPAESQALENAASAALAQAGFKPVEAGKDPDVLVQVGSLEGATVDPVWDDPLWWHGGFGGYYRARWAGGPYWGHPYGGFWGGGFYARSPRYETEVAVLIRDRASGKPLFEAHASTESFSPRDHGETAALFSAALMDFPQLGMNPRRVVVPLGPPAK